jgi:hypothetical protein
VGRPSRWGTNLIGATVVAIGGFGATGVTVVNATTITATTPAHAAGSVDVVVTTPGGTGTGTGIYSYVTAPTVTGISPTGGAIAGGTAVTISGTNLTGATVVTIGGVAATGVTVLNATTITATTPAHAAGSVDVVVTTPAGTGTASDIYTYVMGPTVSAISPSAGPIAGGTAVTISGTSLTGATAVTIGGVSATAVAVVNATTITATTAARAAGVVDVLVTTTGGVATGTALYSYAAIPTVTAIAPTSGSAAGGTAVTITGTGFAGATTVTIGGVAATSVKVVTGITPAAITVVNATTITATTPPHLPGAANVSVTTPGGTGSATGLFTFSATCAVTLSPATLADGAVGAPYSVAITASGGTAPYVFAVTMGTLPPGLSLTASGGLSGTPSVAVAQSPAFTIRGTDALGCFSDPSYTMAIFAAVPTLPQAVVVLLALALTGIGYVRLRRRALRVRQA